ncbi:EthD domain-containing protein [Arthrobacter sp. D3-16]
MGEVWSESRETAAAASETPEWSAVTADAQEFMDLSTIILDWAKSIPPRVRLSSL